MYQEINKCRVCDKTELRNILSLGDQYLTGVFPNSINTLVTKGPMDLVLCPSCSLVQLKQSFPIKEMYGNNYGYRSSLNKSMVNHLARKVQYLESFCQLNTGDIVIDIGSNDATTLKLYSQTGIKRVGIDPVGLKFKNYYKGDVELIPEFFPSKTFAHKYAPQKAKIITSIAMFYDLEDPRKFVEEISKILAEDGIWHFEQSYMPTMLEMNSYDTVCHEHLEYYALRPVKLILEEYGLKILDVQMNDINGGSFAVTAGHKSQSVKAENELSIKSILEKEDLLKLNTMTPYLEFSKRVFQHKDDLWNLIKSIKRKGKTIFGYGASTKGNVLLQFCGFSPKEIPFIAEVNPEKYGCYTPGTNIPIISEEDAQLKKPDYYLVLPWHFKNSIVNREREFINNGGQFIFPLPNIEIIGKGHKILDQMH
jgi:hypothetical protein